MQPHEPILLVDDEPDAVTLLRHAFARAGITNPLHIASDGDEAIAYLRSASAERSKHPYPALVLLDLKLPRTSGLEVLAWIRQEPGLAGLPVVILTSSRERTDVCRAYALGANSYLVKPTSLNGLVQLAEVFRHYWIEYNESMPATGAGPMPGEPPV